MLMLFVNVKSRELVVEFISNCEALFKATTDVYVAFETVALELVPATFIAVKEIV